MEESEMDLLLYVLGILTGVAISIMYLKRKRIKIQQHFETERNIIQLVESSKDIVYYYQVHPEFKQIYTSPSVEHFLGKGILDILYGVNATPFDIIHPDDLDIINRKVSGNIDYSKPIIQRIRSMDGQYKWFEEHTTPVYEDGVLVAINGIMRNIDDKIELEQRLLYKISHDNLTGMYNRDYFEEQMARYNAEDFADVAIVICDVDNLKLVNDTLGHKKGDELIQRAASSLRLFFEQYGVAARMGGDEFAVILEGYDEHQVQNMIEKYEALLLNEDSYMISIGYAYSESSRNAMEVLYTNADHHMYERKRMRKGILV